MMCKSNASMPMWLRSAVKMNFTVIRQVETGTDNVFQIAKIKFITAVKFLLLGRLRTNIKLVCVLFDLFYFNNKILKKKHLD